MSLYNIEIFDSQLNYVSSTTISPCNYNYDYMAIEPTVIEIPIIQCENGNYISIFDGSINSKYWGFINGIEEKSDSMNITVFPLMEKLNVTAYLDRNELSDMTIERFLEELITMTYKNNSDENQNIYGLTINILSAMHGTLNLKDNTHNIYDIAVRALKKYRIFITFDVQINNKKVICNIRRSSTAIPTIEADLENIMNPSFNFVNTADMTNKIFIYGVYDSEHENYGTTLSTVYFMQPNGNITKTPTARILPVVWKTEEITIQDDFEVEALDLANDSLYREEIDNSISFEIALDDSLIRISNYEIGQFVNILKDGSVYRTMFTGYEISPDKIKMIFGVVRNEYTKKLIIERRMS